MLENGVENEKPKINYDVSLFREARSLKKKAGGGREGV